MDISTLFQQIFDALSKATELAISNNKAIAGLTTQVSTLTSQLSEATADDEADAAKIAELEAEKAKTEEQFQQMVAKLEELKGQIDGVPPLPTPETPPSPEPIPAPAPEVPPVAEIPLPPVEVPVETPVVEPAPETPPIAEVPVETPVVETAPVDPSAPVQAPVIQPDGTPATGIISVQPIIF